MARAIVRKANMSADLTGADTTFGLNVAAEYRVQTTNLLIYKGVRSTPFGKIYIPADRTISSAANFNNYDDISEAGTFGSSAWRYFYIKMSDPSKVAISINSPYIKNGGVSNVVTISGTQWIYLGCAYWDGSSWRHAYSSGSKVFFDSGTFGQTAVVCYIIAQSTSNNDITHTINGLFGTHLPGVNTNSKSRIAKEAEFVASGSGNIRNDTGESGHYGIELAAFGFANTEQGTKHIKTPISGSNFFNTSAKIVTLTANCLHNADNLTARSYHGAVIIGANDGNTNCRVGCTWYIDQYIFI